MDKDININYVQIKFNLLYDKSLNGTITNEEHKKMDKLYNIIKRYLKNEIKSLSMR